MTFYHLKMGAGNSEAKTWLDDSVNPLGRPAAVIYFGDNCRTKLPKGHNARQIKSFYHCGDMWQKQDCLIVVVGKGRVWILRPAGAVVELTKPPQDLWKMMPVDVVGRFAMKEVPPVLAGINANTYLSRGTFREIGKWGWGNQKAIASAAGIPLPEEQMAPENCKATHLFECLSSYELETLVAKLFEESGCFVPAYRGGVVRDVDVFAHNDQTRPVNLNGISIPVGGSLAVQVKGWNAPWTCPPEVDVLIGFDVRASPNCFGADWLLACVQQSVSTKAWLTRSLNWLPAEFLGRYSLSGISNSGRLD